MIAAATGASVIALDETILLNNNKILITIKSLLCAIGNINRVYFYLLYTEI
jgi:hypothetical protein